MRAVDGVMVHVLAQAGRVCGRWMGTWYMCWRKQIGCAGGGWGHGTCRGKQIGCAGDGWTMVHVCVSSK